MQRICTSLANAGYEVCLTGRKLNHSGPLNPENFQQKRLPCLFTKGFLFYAEFNFRLFFYLLFTRFDIVCAIDLDTILPCYFASAIKQKKRVYDAHELFTEQVEIISRHLIHRIWMAIGKWAVPKFKSGYTVNHFIRDELQKRYGVDYGVIRNLPVLSQLAEHNTPPFQFIICQGAVNHGRCFETLIPAMKEVNTRLIVCGEGNFFEQAKQLAIANGVAGKIEFKGYTVPGRLKELTGQAVFGLTLFESTGFNQYYSSGNKFFDYIMATIPQICVGYPVYKAINDEFDIALLVDDTEPATLSKAINQLLTDEALYQRLKHNCTKARLALNWETEEKTLIEFYSKL